MKTIKYIFTAAILAVTSSVFTQEIRAKQDEKTQLFGFVNSEDKYIVNPIYKVVDYGFGYLERELYRVVDTKDKIGFVNNQGKLIVPCKYDYVSIFEKGHSVVRYAKGPYDFTFGLMDSTGKEVLPVTYGRLEYYPYDNVLVFGLESTSDIGLMNLKGEILIPAQYAYWSKNISNGLWPVSKNDKCGVVNLKNEIIVPFNYVMIESYDDESGIAAAQKVEYGNYGFIDRTGKTIIPFEYEDAWSSDKFIAVMKNGKWGVIDINNKIILPIEYAEIISIHEKTAWVTKNEGEEMFELDLITKKKVDQD